jgi:hypothetical protein
MIETHVDGRRAMYLKMPTPELQIELSEELEKKIKQRLKASGFERMCTTRREHPFHSSLLRERIDTLIYGEWGGAFRMDESAARARQEGHADIEKLAELKTASGTPYDADAAKQEWDAHVERGRKDYVKRWSKGIDTYRSMLREPLYWRGTSRYYIMFPLSGPALPDTPLPKPVYVSKRNPDLVIQLRDNFVDLYTQVAAE